MSYHITTWYHNMTMTLIFIAMKMSNLFQTHVQLTMQNKCPTSFPVTPWQVFMVYWRGMWPILRYYPSICLEVLRKATNTLVRIANLLTKNWNCDPRIWSRSDNHSTVTFRNSLDMPETLNIITYIKNQDSSVSKVKQVKFNSQQDQEFLFSLPHSHWF